MHNKFLIIEERPSLVLTFLLGISLLIKAVLIYQTDIINPDGIRYLNSAHEFFQGNFAAAFAHEKMLGFTFLLGLAHLVIPDWFLAGKMLSCGALVLTTIPLYFIACELFGRRAAFATALVFTIIPSINSKSTAVIKDPVFLLLLVLSLWLVIYALKQSRWGFSLTAGLLACFAVMVRPEGVIFFLVITMFLTVSALFWADNRSSTLQCLVAFSVLPFTILSLASILFLTGVAPAEVLPGIYARFAHYFQTDLTQTYKSIYQHLKAVEENFPGGQWTNDFFEYARYNIYLIYLLGMLQTFGKALFPVFVLPLIYGLKLREHWNRQLALLMVVLGCFFLMDYLFLLSRNFLSARYLLVPLVLSTVLVGHGIDRLLNVIESLHYRRAFFAVALVGGLLLPLGMSIIKGSDEKLELKAAGAWLAEHQDLARERIIVNEERIAYYAGLLRGEYARFKNMNWLENQAVQDNSAVMIIYLKQQELKEIPDFKQFALVEKISGRKKVAMIYARKL